MHKSLFSLATLIAGLAFRQWSDSNELLRCCNALPVMLIADTYTQVLANYLWLQYSKAGHAFVSCDCAKFTLREPVILILPDR